MLTDHRIGTLTHPVLDCAACLQANPPCDPRVRTPWMRARMPTLQEEHHAFSAAFGSIAPKEQRALFNQSARARMLRAPHIARSSLTCLPAARPPHCIAGLDKTPFGADVPADDLGPDAHIGYVPWMRSVFMAGTYADGPLKSLTRMVKRERPKGAPALPPKPSPVLRVNDRAVDGFTVTWSGDARLRMRPTFNEGNTGAPSTEPLPSPEPGR